MRMQAAVVVLSLCAGVLGAPLEKRSPQIVAAPPPTPPSAINVNSPQAPGSFPAQSFVAPANNDEPEVVAINQQQPPAAAAAPLAAAPLTGFGSRPASSTVIQPAYVVPIPSSPF